MDPEPESPFICPFCGGEHPAGTLYCPVKGVPLYETPQPEPPPPVAALTASGPRRNLTLTFGIAAAVLVLCLALSVAAILLLRQRSAAPRPTPTQAEIILPDTQPTQASPTTPPDAPQPTQTASPEPSPLPSRPEMPWQACPGAAYESRLWPGDTARVSENPPLANRVRSQAGLDSAIVGSIQPGESMEILEGPACSNNWVWWRVRSEKGVEGWTAEGDENNYWLVPAGQ